MDKLRTLGLAGVCAISLTTFAGCGYANNIASGGVCQRTVQCAPGLVCGVDPLMPALGGHCTNDLSMFGMGHPTVLDGGLVDGAAADMGVTMYDTGVPPVDAFSPPVDTGLPPVDAFSPPVDAFTPPVDAFVPPVDAFVPPVDAFVDDDAFVDPGDAG